MTKMTDEKLDEIIENRNKLSTTAKELLCEVNRLRRHITILEDTVNILRAENARLRGYDE